MVYTHFHNNYLLRSSKGMHNCRVSFDYSLNIVTDGPPTLRLNDKYTLGIGIPYYYHKGFLQYIILDSPNLMLK